jgi:hypothetical protein
MSMCLGSLGAEAVPPIGANNYSSLLLLAFSHRMLDQMAKKIRMALPPCAGTVTATSPYLKILGHGQTTPSIGRPKEKSNVAHSFV